MEIRRKIIAVLLLGAAFNSGALTIGRMRGAAIVGQTLDVSIQAQLSADEQAGALCAEADVFHADTRQEPARVRVSVEGSSGQTASIRVTSSAAVDEPVVTIYLKLGCNQKITRRFVMLADVPSEPAPAATQNLPTLAAPAATLPAAGNTSAAAQSTELGSSWAAAQAVPAVRAAPRQNAAPVAKRAPAAAKPRTLAVKKPVAKQAAKPTPKTPAKPVVVAQAAPPAPPPSPRSEEKAAAPKDAASAAAAKAAVADKTAAAQSGQSRLQLDPMVTLAERVTTLEASASSASAASAPVAEASLDAKRVQTLEESVKTLVALASKNEASMLDLRNRLQKAESERVPMAWLYGLGGLLLACLGGLAYLVMRQNSRAASAERDDWWSASRVPVSVAPDQAAVTPQPSGRGELDDGMASEATGARSVRPVRQEPIAGAAAHALVQDAPESEMDVSLVEMSESNFDSLMRSGQAHGALRKAPLAPPVEPPATGVQPMEMTRSINSEQIFDIRQQADFFVSLGQTDQAVRILETRINESGESSPLLYLDLLAIFQSLGLKQDYHQFRDDFNLLFNSRVPEFSAYQSEGRPLEDYPRVLAHITALWPTAKAQMVIEASIFRDPLDDRSKPFDLAAFRDLLLLHAVLQSHSRGDIGISGLAPLSSVPVILQRPAAVARSSGDIDRDGGSDGDGDGVDISLDLADGAVPSKPVFADDLDLDLDLSEQVGSQSKAAKAAKAANAEKAEKAAPAVSEDDTGFPSLVDPAPSKPLAPIKRPNKPTQAIADNHYLDFDNKPTMQYALPSAKDGGKTPGKT